MKINRYSFQAFIRALPPVAARGATCTVGYDVTYLNTVQDIGQL